MSIRAVPRGLFVSRPVDLRQLTLDLRPCVVDGVFNNALLPPVIGVAFRRRSGRVCRPRPGRSVRPAVWPVYWMPFREVAAVGDSDYVRVAIPWV